MLALDADNSISISDFIVINPEDKPSENLKKCLMEFHSESEELGILSLTHYSMVPRICYLRLSQLLECMRNLAGDTLCWCTNGIPLTFASYTITRNIVDELNDVLPQTAPVTDKIYMFWVYFRRYKLTPLRYISKCHIAQQGQKVKEIDAVIN